MKSSLKFLLGTIAAPLAISFLLGLIALAFRIAGYRRSALGLFAAGVTVGYLGSVSIVGDALLVPLEGRYSAFRESAHSEEKIAAIVVLGAWYGPRDTIPITSALSADGLARIAEGVRLAVRYPAAKLVVSGGAPHGGVASAIGYARFAREFGIPAERLVAVPNAFDTAQEAREVSKLLARQRFILVTSASHMPRSIALMERQGARPLPAPTAHRTAGRLEFQNWYEAILPSSLGLSKTEAAWHEYLGLLAISLGLD